MKRRGGVGRAGGALLVGWLLLAGPAGAWAQGCQLVPVPLAERVREATVIVEAQVASQQTEELRPGRLVTRSTLTVFRVFKGQLPAGPLTLLSPGGTLGLRREVASGLEAPAVGTQGVFLLEPDPDYPGEQRLAAGPQGLLAYDLRTLTASDPFARYPAIGGGLYPTLAALTGQPARPVQPNLALAAAQARASQPAAQRTAATAVIGSFSPTTATAGTSTTNRSSNNGLLTISGSGFNATRGTGYVSFRNADDGGNTYIQPLPTDYVSWSDTQIQVRVPSAGTAGNAAGTGTIQVTNSDNSTATSAGTLTVTYALANARSTFNNTRPLSTYAVRLAGTSETEASPGTASNPSGYLLHYTASTAAGTQVPAEARTSFEAALTTWRCQAGANRTLGADAAPTTNTRDGVNLVAFGALSNGVLGVTYTYFQACTSGADTNWELGETDYIFTNSGAVTWYYGTGTPPAGQYDFQSVALHEQGHGILLAHIINSARVMHYAIGAAVTRRTLSADTDLAAANDETTYSTGATYHCGTYGGYAGRSFVTYATSTDGCALPVELVAFTARYAPGPGTQLSWTTASELHSAYFAVESQEAGTRTWQELTRQPAAGSSATTRTYQARDPRPLAGTRYYRLRQADDDGTVAYSPVAAVQGEAGTLAAYPNPATGLVHLSGPLAEGAIGRVQLLDALGRPVREATATRPDVDLSLAGLPPGLYVLVWDGGTGPQRLRLTVE